MNVESLNCNHCGAPLQVPDSAKYVKCNHCASQLVIRREASATFTETVDRLSETTENLSEQVSKLTKQNELELLEKRWAGQRESFMIPDKHGIRHLPDEGSSLLSGVAIVVFGCIWTAMAIGITSSAPNFGPFQIAKVAFPLFGVMFVVFGVMQSVRHHQKAKEYRNALQRYQREREELLNE